MSSENKTTGEAQTPIEWLRGHESGVADCQGEISLLNAVIREQKEEITRLGQAMNEAYAILCSGNPPHSPREANARRKLRDALKEIGNG